MIGTIIESAEYGLSYFDNKKIVTYDFHFDSVYEKNKPWLAHISGIDTKYGFARDFKGTSRLFGERENLGDYFINKITWTGLELGNCYEYRNFMVEPKGELLEGFFVVYLDGIVEMEKEEIRGYLNMGVKKKIKDYNDSLKDESEDNFCMDDIPF